MWLLPHMQQELMTLAMERQVEVFKRPGLMLLAAPWEYAFIAKISQLISRVEARDYDLDDAVDYLHQVVALNNRPANLASIEQWTNHSNHQTNTNIPAAIKRAYER